MRPHLLFRFPIACLQLLLLRSVTIRIHLVHDLHQVFVDIILLRCQPLETVIVSTVSVPNGSVTAHALAPDRLQYMVATQRTTTR